MNDQTIRPVDRARVTQLIISHLLRDELMFAEALNEIVYDDYGLGQQGAVINALLVMSQDLAGILVDAHGVDEALEHARSLLASQLAEDTHE